MLHINELTYRIEGRPILDQASVAIATGHKAGLVGRNGAGKSTILRMLIGAQRPDEGRVEFEGLRMAETDAAIRRGVATMVPVLESFNAAAAGNRGQAAASV